MTALPQVRDLDGKVALVIGGSRNMGAAFVGQIAARGATTAISYSTDGAAAEQTVALLNKHGVTAEAVRSDATVSADVDAQFQQTAFSACSGPSRPGWAAAC